MSSNSDVVVIGGGEGARTASPAPSMASIVNPTRKEPARGFRMICTESWS
jgi:hypothetical protein